jgi:translation initiation factor 2 gamma subunit (eIF-2gamma)
LSKIEQIILLQRKAKIFNQEKQTELNDKISELVMRKRTRHVTLKQKKDIDKEIKRLEDLYGSMPNPFLEEAKQSEEIRVQSFSVNDLY